MSEWTLFSIVKKFKNQLVIVETIHEIWCTTHCMEAPRDTVLTKSVMAKHATTFGS
jgi:hypothetical protein